MVSYERLLALSPEQRERLSRRLDELGAPPDQADSVRRDPRLVAFVVPKKDLPVTVEDLRREIKEKLPAYLVPSEFILVDSLPRAPNGKVDREALSALRGQTQLADGESQKPRPPLSGTQRTLIEIWRLILGREDVGIDENFFDLGGHSVLATLAVSRVREAFSVDLPLRALFEKPTISELSEVIDESRKKGKRPAEPPLMAVPRQAHRGNLPQTTRSD